MEFGKFQPPLTLTDQERLLLGLVLEELGARQMAQQANVAERTVRASLVNIGKKLEVFSRL